jgi:hypothetical protein
MYILDFACLNNIYNENKGTMQAHVTILTMLALLLCGCETLPVSNAPVIEQEAAVINDQCGGRPEQGSTLHASFMDVDIIKEIQARLILLGYSTGRIDGIYGKKTEQGIRTYQAANHLLVDGRPTPQLLEHIKNIQRANGVDLSRITPQIATQTSE